MGTPVLYYCNNLVLLEEKEELKDLSNLGNLEQFGSEVDNLKVCWWLNWVTLM